MSFHYVLPSNTSLETFPENNASLYSTPLEQPLILTGDWEVGALSINHSNCINTFNNDIITIKDKKKALNQTRQPTKINIPPYPVEPAPNFGSNANYLKNLIERLNTQLMGIVTFSLNKLATVVNYEFQTKQHHLFLNTRLQQALGLPNCLSHHDIAPKGIITIKPGKFHEQECYMIIIPISSTPQTTVKLEKSATDDASPWSFKRLRDLLDQQIVAKTTNRFQFNTSTYRFNSQPSKDQTEMALVVNKDLQQVLDDYNDGLIVPSSRFTNLAISLYSMDVIKEYDAALEYLEHPIILERKMFQSVKHLCEYVTKRIGYSSEIELTQVGNVAHLKITAPHLQVVFSKDVQDILAFEQQSYTGKCSVIASGIVSLTRRIDYLFIYSNLGEFVRIGDTEAPLLCVFPHNSNTCGVITERNFKLPTYVKVKGQQFSQIDIGIYDGAGQLIPFHREARTVIRLHFRRQHH